MRNTHTRIYIYNSWHADISIWLKAIFCARWDLLSSLMTDVELYSRCILEMSANDISIHIILWHLVTAVCWSMLSSVESSSVSACPVSPDDLFLLVFGRIRLIISSTFTKGLLFFLKLVSHPPMCPSEEPLFSCEHCTVFTSKIPSYKKIKQLDLIRKNVLVVKLLPKAGIWSVMQSRWHKRPGAPFNFFFLFF